MQRDNDDEDDTNEEQYIINGESAWANGTWDKSDGNPAAIRDDKHNLYFGNYFGFRTSVTH